MPAALPFRMVHTVRETTTPHNYKPVDDFIVRITEHSPNTPCMAGASDEEFEAKLKIIKQDDETKSRCFRKTQSSGSMTLIIKICRAGDNLSDNAVHTLFTDEEGYLILPQNLPIGHYRIEEVTAPRIYAE